MSRNTSRSNCLPRLQLSWASSHLETTLMMALPASCTHTAIATFLSPCSWEICCWTISSALYAGGFISSLSSVCPSTSSSRDRDTPEMVFLAPSAHNVSAISLFLYFPSLRNSFFFSTDFSRGRKSPLSTHEFHRYTCGSTNANTKSSEEDYRRCSILLLRYWLQSFSPQMLRYWFYFFFYFTAIAN